MLRPFVILFAIVFLGVGILGFFPFYLGNGQLFDLFRVNAETNSLHLAMGAFALIVVFIKERIMQLYFQILGVLLSIWGVLGFAYDENRIFGLFANNVAWTWFHIILAVIALILGFGSKEI